LPETRFICGKSFTLIIRAQRVPVKTRYLTFGKISVFILFIDEQSFKFVRSVV